MCETIRINGVDVPVDSLGAGPDSAQMKQAHQDYRNRRGVQSGADFGGIKSPRMMKHRPTLNGVRVK